MPALLAEARAIAHRSERWKEQASRYTLAHQQSAAKDCVAVAYRHLVAVVMLAAQRMSKFPSCDKARRCGTGHTVAAKALLAKSRVAC